MILDTIQILRLRAIRANWQQCPSINEINLYQHILASLTKAMKTSVANTYRFRIACYLIVLFLPVFAFSQEKANIINIVFTSDAHYGITREKFRGDTGVTGHIVNAAMIKQINTLPGLTLPEDDGISAGEKVSAIDYFIETGDISNRMEYPIQTAATSWAQFTQDYFNGV